MASRPRLSRQILVKVVPGAVLLVILISLFTVRYVERELLALMQQDVEKHARNLARATQTELVRSVESSVAIAKNDVAVNSIVDTEYRNYILPSFVRSLEMPSAAAHNIAIVNYTGQRIAEKHPDRTEHEDCLKQWLPKVADGENYLAVHDSLLVVAAPILYGHHPEAAIVVTYPLDLFLGRLLEESEFQVDAFTFNGKAVATSDSRFVLPSGRLDGSASDWLVASSEISLIPGLEVVVMRSNFSASQATAFVRWSMVFSVGAILLVLLAGILLAVKAATSPLHALIEAIDQVKFKRDLGRRVDVGGCHEFELLGKRFNSMLAELEKTTVTKEKHRIPALVARYTDNAVIITDAEGCIEWVNEAFENLSGYTSQEVIGQRPGDLLQGPETSAKAIQHMRESLAAKQGFDVELVNYSKQGNAYWVAIEARPIYGEDGSLEKFIAVESDISARKEAEAKSEELAAQLQDSARQAGMAEVATDVLHNVGNVLNSVNVSATLMQDQLRASPIDRLEKAAAIIEEQASDIGEFMSKNPRGKAFPAFLSNLSSQLTQSNQEQIGELKTLIDNIDHIKEIVSMQQSLAQKSGITETISPRDLIEQAIGINKSLLEKSDIRLETDLATNDSVTVSKHEVIQILINLIRNAAQALQTSEQMDRRIQVMTRRRGALLEIEVADNGVGIAPDVLAKIFRHGFTTKKSGHGFGLHSCANAANNMGGNLKVTSGGLGKGASFILSLPC